MKKEQEVIHHARLARWVIRFPAARAVSAAVLLAVSAIASAAPPPAEEVLVLPLVLEAEARVLRGERDGLWEKTLLVAFPQRRRTLSTFDGLVEADAVINHSAHPWLWERMTPAFTHGKVRGGQAYIEYVRERVASRLGTGPARVAQMATAADLDTGEYIEGENPDDTHGTINIMLLTNARLTDGAMARAVVAVTEAKTAALQDLQVPSTYTPAVQATGTGSDGVIVVSGTSGPRATYAGGHSRLGGLIGEAAHQAVVEALGKQNGFFPPGAKKFQGERNVAGKPAGSLRIALLHMDSVPGDVAGNRARIEAGIAEAWTHGADWVVTPELAETGYNFFRRIGGDWIAPFPDAWMHGLSAIARDNGIALFAGFAERDAKTSELHNSVAAIDRQGAILGAYHKRKVHGYAEAWSRAGGEEQTPFVVDGVPVGVLICADAYYPEVAAQIAARGAAILLSPANWPDVGNEGPKDVWEKRSRETGLPLVVNNRTGQEPELDFTQSESVVSVDGRRLFTFASPESRVFYVDWDGKLGFSAVAEPLSERSGK
jgi:predicted amidohydrolase/adenosylcobinamide amidohydrolase